MYIVKLMFSMRKVIVFYCRNKRLLILPLLFPILLVGWFTYSLYDLTRPSTGRSYLGVDMPAGTFICLNGADREKAFDEYIIPELRREINEVFDSSFTDNPEERNRLKKKLSRLREERDRQYKLSEESGDFFSHPAICTRGEWIIFQSIKGQDAAFVYPYAISSFLIIFAITNSLFFILRIHQKKKPWKEVILYSFSMIAMMVILFGFMFIRFAGSMG